MNIKQTLSWLGGTALLAVSLNASALNVDLFSTDQPLMTDSTVDGNALTSFVGDGTDLTILGGARDLSVELLTTGGNAFAKAEIGVGGGSMSFSVTSQATGTGTVQWDGADDTIALDPIGLGGVDLTSGGASNVFAIVTLFADLGFEFIITAWTDSTHWTSISFSATQVASSTTSYIPFAAFTNVALCGATNPDVGVNSITCGGTNTPAGGLVADFTNLGALELQIDPSGGTISVDLTLDSITIPERVPEPSVLGLLGIGLLVGGLTSFGRRRKS